MGDPILDTKKKRKKLLYAILLIAGLTITAVSAQILMTQFFPSLTVSAPALTANCGTSQGSPLTATTGTSQVIFSCNSQSAFQVANGAITATPTVAGFSGYTALVIVPDTSVTCTGGQSILAGTSLILAVGSYNYCAQFTPPGIGQSTTFPAFSVQWST